MALGLQHRTRMVRSRWRAPAIAGALRDPDVTMLPAGMDYLHYRQRMWGVDVFYQRDMVELRAEGIIDEWDVPNVPD